MLTLFERATEREKFAEVNYDNLTEANLQGLHKVMKRALAARRPILDCIFSRRADNVLKRCRILTLGELSEWTGEFQQAGGKTYAEFKHELDRADLPYPRVVRNFFLTNRGA